MYSGFRIATKYIKYLLKASNAKGHGIHSPFVFGLIQHVFLPKGPADLYAAIEAQRNDLLLDKTQLPMKDFGAGSRSGDSPKRKVADIARNSLKAPKYAQLMHRLCEYMGVKQALEIGTSLGITSAYIASANGLQQLTTLEGSPAIAKRASEVFENLGLSSKIVLVEGNFDDTLSGVLDRQKPYDFVFVDGNHRYEPTVAYCKAILPAVRHSSVLIMDDIHWSKEMEEAWQWMQQCESVKLTIDLFFLGLVFFNEDIKVPQHFTIRF